MSERSERGPSGPAAGQERSTSDDAPAGLRLLRAAVGGTVVFVVAALVAAAFPDALAVPVAVLDLVLFAVGLVAFAAALVVAAGRSRFEEVSVAGLFLLSGSAPSRVRRVLLGALAVQTAVALATAAARPFTSLAFGILVPTFGIAACGLWAARYGSFPSKGAPGGTRAGPATPDAP